MVDQLDIDPDIKFLVAILSLYQEVPRVLVECGTRRSHHTIYVQDLEGVSKHGKIRAGSCIC